MSAYEGPAMLGLSVFHVRALMTQAERDQTLDWLRSEGLDPNLIAGLVIDVWRPNLGVIEYDLNAQGRRYIVKGEGGREQVAVSYRSVKCSSSFPIEPRRLQRLAEVPTPSEYVAPTMLDHPEG